MANGSGTNGGELPAGDAARVAEPIARIAAAGLPMGPGLRAAAAELPRDRARATLGALADAIDAGAGLDEAAETLGDRIPPHLRGLIRVGVRTGDPAGALSRYIGFARVAEDVRRRLATSLVYPVLAMALSVALFVFVCVNVVASFESIFLDFGIPVPVLTSFLIGVSRVVQRGWRPLMEVAIGLGVLGLALRFLLGASARRGLVSSLPVIGGVWKNTSLAEFCHLLGLLLESGISLGEALRLTGGGVGDDRFQRAGAQLAADVTGGLSLSQAVLRQGLLPRGLARLLRWAEGNRSLPEALRMAGQMFEARANAQARFAGSVLTVVAVLSLFVGVTAVVLGVMLPMITLISRLSG